MEKYTLLQSFALNNHGELVSVRDVERGKACDCCCPACGEVLIARQGEVRAWHFAHESGSDCEGAAESALHLAAKQIILHEARVMTPPIEVTASHTLPDGRCGIGTSFLPSAYPDLQGIQLEVPIAGIRPDIFGYSAGTPLIIEIAVTHPVDEEKSGMLKEIGFPAMEIELIPALFPEWTWESLRQAVLEDPLNRHWIYHPEKERLARDAEEKAIGAAQAQPQLQQSTPKQTKLRLNGVPTHLTDYPWGFCVWYPYNDQTYAIIKDIARRFGGRWKPRYRNWSFPPGAREAVETQLRELGATDRS